MENFNYHRPATVNAAAALLKKSKGGSYMAGGHTLLPTMKQGLASPSDIIDLTAIKGFSGITVTQISRGDQGRNDPRGCGDICRRQESHSRPERDGWKNRRCSCAQKGTIGGSIANNDPAADYPSACLGLGATIVTNKRKIPADAFFTGMFQTALKDGEIITEVSFPIPKKSSHMKFPNPASRYALVGVFLSQGTDGKVRVAVTGAGPKVFRVPEMEAALSKNFAVSALAGISAKAKGLNSDMHATAEYRAHLIGVLARRAVEAAK